MSSFRYDCSGFLYKLDSNSSLKGWAAKYVALSKLKRTISVWENEEHYKLHCKTWTHNYLEQIPLQCSSVYIADYIEKSHAFELTTPSQSHFFYCKSSDEMKNWMVTIVDSGCINKAPEKELIMYTANQIMQYERAVTDTYAKYGYLQKRGAYNKSFKTRFFRTQENAGGEPVLVYYTSPDSTAYNGVINLKGAKFEPGDEESLEFSIVTNNRTFTIRAPSKLEKNNWLTVLATLSQTDLHTTRHAGKSIIKHDLYEILGLTQSTANAQSIAAAYKEKALTTHPDKNTASDAAQQFAAVQEAYEILKNPTRRSEYDYKRKILLQRRNTRTEERVMTGVNAVSAKENQKEVSQVSYKGNHDDEKFVIGGEEEKKNKDNEPTPAPIVPVDPASIRVGEDGKVYRKRVVKKRPVAGDDEDNTAVADNTENKAAITTTTTIPATTTTPAATATATTTSTTSSASTTPAATTPNPVVIVTPATTTATNPTTSNINTPSAAPTPSTPAAETKTTEIKQNNLTVDTAAASPNSSSPNTPSSSSSVPSTPLPVNPVLFGKPASELTFEDIKGSLSALSKGIKLFKLSHGFSTFKHTKVFIHVDDATKFYYLHWDSNKKAKLVLDYSFSVLVGSEASEWKKPDNQKKLKTTTKSAGDYCLSIIKPDKTHSFCAESAGEFECIVKVLQYLDEENKRKKPKS